MNSILLIGISAVLKQWVFPNLSTGQDTALTLE